MEALSISHTSPTTTTTSIKLLVEDEAAAALRLAPRTLARHRADGTGPVFIRLGRRVLYNPEDLMEWARSHRYRSTSEPTIQPASMPPRSRRKA